MSLLDKLEYAFEKLQGKQGQYVQTPTILQMEITECGAASLAILMGYYGRWITLEQLREDCGVTRDGSTAKNLLLAAEKHGFSVKGKRMGPKRVKNYDHPLILYWNYCHFVVYEGWLGDEILINDPSAGRRRVSWQEFTSSFSGIALDIVPGEVYEPQGECYNVVQSVKRRLLKEKGAVLYIVLLSLFLVLPNLASSAYNQIFMDDIVTMKYGEKLTESWLDGLLIIMAITAVMLLVLTAMRQWMMTELYKKIAIADSAKFLWHTLRLPLNYYQQRSPNEISSRVEMNLGVADVMSGQAATALLDGVLLVFYLVLLLCYSVKLTILGLIFGSLSALAFLVIRRKLLNVNLQLQQEHGKAYGTSVAGIMMIENLKANGIENDFYGRLMGYKTNVLDNSQKQQRYGLLLDCLPAMFMALNTALLMTLGSFDIIDGLMTTGIFFAFQSLMGKFNEPVNNILHLGNTLQTTEMQLRRLDDVLKNQEDELNFPSEASMQAMTYKGDYLQGELELRHLCFGYSRRSPALFKDFNLHLKPGSWAALVGESGSGKSTIARIVLGIYEEWSGEVLFDGVLRRQVPRAVLCNSLANVDQNFFLMEGTVRDNISMFDGSITQQDVVEAAKDACIYEDIMNLENGFDHLVAEGGKNFSGGQRQRLEIARALATNPRILILDEATSALDPVTEAKVVANIRHRGCTCIVVAHRLSTIRDCDEIIVIKAGDVVERGTHRSLMEQQGYYAELVGTRAEGKVAE